MLLPQAGVGLYDRAGALLDALATGGRAPPELRAPGTPRAGVSVEHRVLVVLNPDAPAPEGGWSSGVRDAVAPALEAWIASTLPPPNNVTVSAAAGLALSDLGLSALDAVYLMGDDVTGQTPAIRTLVAAALGRGAGVERDTPADPSAITLQEFATVAIELRRALDGLRPADARDLRPAHAAGDPDRDDHVALAAAENAMIELRELVAELDVAVGAGAPVATAVERLARFGLATGTAPADPATAIALLPLARRRLAAAEAVTVDAIDPRPGLERRLAAVLLGRVPLLGSFPIDGDAIDLVAGAATPEEASDWLDGVARVRPAIGRLWAAGLLGELIAPERGLRAVATQSPHGPGDPWAATGPTAVSRLSVCGIIGPDGPPKAGGKACGLVIDQWSEVVPRIDQTTALALQYDAPSNRPPQAWLLAVTPDGEPWNLALVIDTLLDTLEWARMRAVTPEDLLDYGRAIPTTFVPGGIARWPVET